MGTNRNRDIRLGIFLTLVIAGAVGCQAGARVQGSMLDECARPTFANRDWCLSAQFPNLK